MVPLPQPHRLHFPTTFSLLTLRSTGNVEGSRIGKDRSESNWHFDGDYGELLVYNTELSVNDIEKIEGYLAHKWGLIGSLASAHPYKSTTISQPVVSIDSVGSTSGTASVTLLETGGADVSVSYYYGTTDKGETTSGWDFDGSLSGAQSAGSVVALNGLSASTQYVFRIKATNSAGTVWTNATNFTTGSKHNRPRLLQMQQAQWLEPPQLPMVTYSPTMVPTSPGCVSSTEAISILRLGSR